MSDDTRTADIQACEAAAEAMRPSDDGDPLTELYDSDPWLDRTHEEIEDDDEDYDDLEERLHNAFAAAGEPLPEGD